MKESRKGPAPCFPHEPLLREEVEQYPTSQYNSPPVPSFASLLPRGLVGYEEMKREQTAEAKRDREEPELLSREDQQDAKRWSLITMLAIRFPQLNVPAIAEGVVPWDGERFKQLVAEAQVRYLKEMT